VRRALLLVLVAGCSPPACSDAEERQLMNDVRLVAEDDGPLAEAASRRLTRAGHRAIAPLETGLYFFSAEAKGRRRIVKTLAAIGDPDAAPLLQHLAERDPDPDVRSAAEAALAALTPPR
jgi:HEAT repeat protein